MRSTSVLTSEPKRVAARHRRDDAGVHGPAQPHHHRLERLGGIGGRLSTPGGLDQRIGSQRPARRHRERPQHPRRLTARDRHRTVAEIDRNRADQAQLHGGRLDARPVRDRSATAEVQSRRHAYSNARLHHWRPHRRPRSVERRPCRRRRRQEAEDLVQLHRPDARDLLRRCCDAEQHCLFPATRTATFTGDWVGSGHRRRGSGHERDRPVRRRRDLALHAAPSKGAGPERWCSSSARPATSHVENLSAEGSFDILEGFGTGDLAGVTGSGTGKADSIEEGANVKGTIRCG